MNQRTALARIAALALLTAPLLLSGCSQLTYGNVKLRESPQQYEKKLPSEQSRRTSVGLTYYNQSWDGKTEAIVVLLSTDRRVAGKIMATRTEPKPMMLQSGTFTLVGELDPELYDMRSTGPIDTLRVIARSLSEYRGEKLATDAHNLVTAGLVRLMQRWPRVEDVGVTAERLPSLFALAGGTGAASISVDSKGVYHFEYRLGAR